MPKTAWTHHETIEAIAPFVKAGRACDLAASNRDERRICFKPVVHSVAGGFSIREVLWLENPWPGSYRLARDLYLPNGLQARLTALGPEPGGLLAAIESVPLERSYHFGDGFILAKSHSVEPFGWAPTPDAPTARLALAGAEATAAGLSVRLATPSSAGCAAEVSLSRTPGDTLGLPDDFLSVLGTQWQPLMITGAGWSTRLSLRGREPFRSLRTETLFEGALVHLSLTLSSPPRHFHDRLARSRWIAEARRAAPLAAALLFAAALAWLAIAPWSPVATAIVASPFIAFLLFGNRVLNVPSLHLPRRPRPIEALAWRSVRRGPPPRHSQ